MKTKNLKLIMLIVIALQLFAIASFSIGCNKPDIEQTIDAEFMTRVDALESQSVDIEDPELKMNVLDNYHAILGMIQEEAPYEDINALLTSTEELISDYKNSEIPQSLLSEKASYLSMLNAIPDNSEVKWQVWDLLMQADTAILIRNKTQLELVLKQAEEKLDAYFGGGSFSYEQISRKNALASGIFSEIKKKENFDELVVKYNAIQRASAAELNSLLIMAEDLLANKLNSESTFAPSATDISTLKNYINSKISKVMPSYQLEVNNVINMTGTNNAIYERLFEMYKNIDNITFENTVPNKTGIYNMLASTKELILGNVKYVRDNYSPLYIQAEEFYLKDKLAESYEYLLYVNKYISAGTLAPSFRTPNKGDLSARLDVVTAFLPQLSGVELTRYSVGIEKADAMIANKQFAECDVLLGSLEMGLINLSFTVPYYKTVWLTGIDYKAYSPAQAEFVRTWGSQLSYYMNKAYDNETEQDITNLSNYISDMKAGVGDMGAMPEERNQYWSGYDIEEIYDIQDLETYLSNTDFADFTSGHYSVEMLPYVSLGKATADATIMTQTMRVSVHLSYYALAGIKMYKNDPTKQDEYNMCLVNLQACVNNWIKIQEFGGNGIFPFPDISSVGGNVGSICKRMIESGIPTKTDPIPMSEGGYGTWIIEENVSDGGIQYDNGLIVGALYHIWNYFKDIDVEFANKCKDAIVWNADTFLLNHNLVKNFNYNAFSVEALSYAYAMTDDSRYLEDAIKKFKYGVINGMITEGRMAGRWFDAHNAKMVYQTILVRACGTLVNVCPTTHPYYNTLKQQAAMAFQGVFNDVITFGSCPDGSYFESLLLEMLNLYPTTFGWTEDYKTTMNIITNAFMQRDKYDTPNFTSCSVYASPLWVYIENLKEVKK